MAWKETEPIEGILAPDLNDVIRDNNEALEAALDAWCYFATGGTQDGRPRQGSAIPFFQDAAPTTRLDGNAFTATDYGTIWIDSNSSPDNQYNTLTNHSPVTWTPISTEVIAVMIAAIHTWAAIQTFSEIPVFTKGLYANDAFLQARNAVGNGNVDLIKANASDVPEVPDGATLASSAAPTADAEIANKKYVDDQLAWNHDGTEVRAVADGNCSIDWNNELDLSGNVGAAYALVLLKVNYGATAIQLAFKPYADSDTYGITGANTSGVNSIIFGANTAGLVMCETDTNGKLRFYASATETVSITLVGYVKEV